MYNVDIYTDYALRIWKNHPNIAKDRLRWHSSDYHIKEKSLSVDDAVEDAIEALDVDPIECGIDIPSSDWQEKYLVNPDMVSVMAEIIYANLAHHNKYSFSEEPDWHKEVRKYILDSL